MGGAAITGIDVAAADLGALAEFLALFGYRSAERDPAVMSVGRGADLHLHRADVDDPALTGFACGPRALDVYVRDLDAALARVPFTPGPRAEISLGPVRMRQAMLTGPGGVQVVLVESTHRRPSLLDDDPERLCSEIYSVIWCVPSRDDEAARWTAAGFTKGIDLSFGEPSLSAYLGLPVDGAIVEMVTLSDADGTPTRLELLAFPDHTEPVGGGRRSGIVGLRFSEPVGVGLSAEVEPGAGVAPDTGIGFGLATPGGIVIR